MNNTKKFMRKAFLVYEQLNCILLIIIMLIIIKLCKKIYFYYPKSKKSKPHNMCKIIDDFQGQRIVSGVML